MNNSQSFRKGRNTHLVPHEYLQIKTYRQTALGELSQDFGIISQTFCVNMQKN